MRIIVTRHGQTDWNQQRKLQGDLDIELNETGRDQAEQLRQALAEENIGVIYTSDLQRAQETAHIVNEHFDVPVFVDHRLNEFDWGVFKGTTKYHRDEHPELSPLWQEVNTNIETTQRHKGDYFPHYQRDIHQALTDITDFHDGQTILLVTHGFAKRVIAAAIMGKLYSEMRDVYWENTSYSIFQLNDQQGFDVHAFNESPER